MNYCDILTSGDTTTIVSPCEIFTFVTVSNCCEQASLSILTNFGDQLAYSDTTAIVSFDFTLIKWLQNHCRQTFGMILIKFDELLMRHDTTTIVSS